VNDVIIDIITNPKDADDAKIELSEREVFVLKLICEEKTSKEIADKLQVTEKIIHNLRSKLMDKTRSKTSAGLVIFAMKNGIHK
jgi:DNA-binding CsgD family transcriptional regulator